jgi:YD repeat-containing protein
MSQWCPDEQVAPDFPPLDGNGRVSQTRPMKTFTAATAALLIATAAHAEPQTRFYDARGNSVGTAVPQGEGTVRYYDAQGRSLGTSTTNSTGTTTFYGPRGNVTGTAAPSFGRGK